MSASVHVPVMTKEVVQALNIRTDGFYVDATFGRGGHTRAILSRLGPGGRVLAIDRDPDACQYAMQVCSNENRLTFVRAPFSDLHEIIQSRGHVRRVTGVVLDLGVSSPQLDEDERGFSFTGDGPLDMRMDPSQGQPAAQWLKDVKETELYRVLRDLGEERFARRVARAVVRARGERPLTRTSELAQLVSRTVPGREPGKHPATRTFQAVRMQVNGELEQLQSVLPQALDVLEPKGRLVVISFHSLEDHIVKHFMRRAAKGDYYPPELPVTQDQIIPELRLVSGPTRPGTWEVRRNTRARSAVLRTAEKINGASQ